MNTEFSNPLHQEGNFHQGLAPADANHKIRSSRNSSIRMAVALAALFLLPNLSPAATNDLTTTLQKALFEEEANHNLGAAIQLYQSVVSQFDKDRKLAATAVFRLAECYRKQGNTNEANAQYDRVLREFSDQAQLATLSRQNLLALGGSLPEAASTPTAARQEQKKLLEQELALIEKKLATDQKKVQMGIISSGELLSTQREMLQVKRQIAALDANIPEMRDLFIMTNEPAAEPSTSAEAEEVRRIQAMIKDSPDLINAKPDNGLAPLNSAASKGHLVVAQFLLEHGADVEVKNPLEQCTPIHYAAYYGHKAIVELLLSHKARVNATEKGGKTPLHMAAEKGFRSVVEVLVTRGADINAKDVSGATPLHFAVATGFRAVTELLLTKDADPNVIGAINTPGRGFITGTPLHVAVARADQPIAELLLARKADPNSTDREGKTPLDLAAAAGNTDMAEVLLSHGAEVNAKNQNASELGWTPLHYAVLPNEKQMVDLLLKHKADPNAVIQTGFTVASSGMAPGMMVPPRIGMPGEQPARADYTPLLMACTKGFPEIVASLLDAGAKPDFQSQKGETAIINTINNVRPPDRNRLLDLLLEHGANPEAKNPDGKTALLVAAELRDRASLEVLLKHKADAKARTPVYAATPLHLLVFSIMNGIPQGQAQDVPAMAQDLVAAGADVNAQDHQGKTPLNYLAELLNSRNSGNLATVKELADVLRKAGAVEDLARLDVIQIGRKSANWSTPVFSKGKGDYNYFTLFELIGAHFGFMAGSPQGPGPVTSFDGASRTSVNALRFPDLVHVVIRRPKPDRTQWTTQAVNLSELFQSDYATDACSDEKLGWGDVVEIPEADHPINAIWQGLSPKDLAVLDRCLSRHVQLTVKGSTTNILLKPNVQPGGLSARPGAPGGPPSFYLLSVLYDSGMLRASSDLSRVKVSRQDPASGQPWEMVFDCSPNRPPDKVPDLWLRDGDVIEVPERPES